MFNAWSIFDGRFVDQHYRNVILDRIDPAAPVALEAGAILDEADRSLAFRAYENLDKRWVNSHLETIRQKAGPDSARRSDEPRNVKESR